MASSTVFGSILDWKELFDALIRPDEFYDDAFNHIVDPHEELDRNFLRKNMSNKVPKDFDEIEKSLK